MEEDVGFLSVDWHITGRAFRDRIRRCGQILSLFIFAIFLERICLKTLCFGNQVSITLNDCIRVEYPYNIYTYKG